MLMSACVVAGSSARTSAEPASPLNSASLAPSGAESLAPTPVLVPASETVRALALRQGLRAIAEPEAEQPYHAAYARSPPVHAGGWGPQRPV